MGPLDNPWPRVSEQSLYRRSILHKGGVALLGSGYIDAGALCDVSGSAAAVSGASDREVNCLPDVLLFMLPWELLPHQGAAFCICERENRLLSLGPCEV